MAVITSFAFDFVQTTDLTHGPTTSQADATSLANGGFAVSGTHAGHVDIDIFNVDLTDAGGSNVNAGTNSAIDQLANGNLVFVTQDADSILHGIKNGTGGSVLEPIDFDDTNSSSADVAALTGGNYVIVSQDNFGGTNFDIDLRVVDSGGSVINGFVIDASAANDQGPSVAALDDGGFAVAFTRTIGADTEIQYAVFNSTGGVVKALAIADSFGTVNRNVDVSSKSGGFVLAYEDSGFGTGTNDITLAEFTLAGTFQSFSNISNPALINDGSNDANPAVTRLSNNLLVVGFEDNSFGDTDNIVALFDASTNTRLATRNITGGESVVDDVGDLTIAGSNPGRINVFQSNFTDADVDGETIVGRRTSTGDGANDVIVGDGFIDNMNGNAGNDRLSGGGNNDSLLGDLGNDILFGGTGGDALNGGTGREFMTGGPGSDVFDFNSTAESGITGPTRDRITDFTHLTDVINLVDIDATTSTPGTNDVFFFRGSLAFNAEGQVRVIQSGANTIILLNTTGTTGAEMSIQLDAFTAATLTAADFNF